MVKTAIKLREKRISERKAIVGLLPGRLLYRDTVLNAKATDVSPHGIGLIIDQFIQAGDVIVMELPDSSLEFKIAWIKPDFGKHDLWRVGVMATDHRQDVEKIFKDHGCLKS